MKIMDLNGEEWMLDWGLREKAQRLIVECSDLVHIDLKHVVFLRSLDGKKGKALGSCFYLKPPLGLTMYYMLEVMKKSNAINLDVFNNLDQTFFDIRYLIVLYDQVIEDAEAENSELFEEAILYHELKHINADMDGLESHTIKDFPQVLSKYGVYYASGVLSKKTISSEDALQVSE